MPDDSDWKKEIEEIENDYKEKTKQTIIDLEESGKKWEKARETLEEIAKKNRNQSN